VVWKKFLRSNDLISAGESQFRINFVAGIERAAKIGASLVAAWLDGSSPAMTNALPPKNHPSAARFQKVVRCETR
jgi:hypothetical protein